MCVGVDEVDPDVDYQIEHISLSCSSSTGLYSPLVCLFLPSTDWGTGNKVTVKERGMEVAKWHFRVSVKSYFRTGFMTPFGTWVGSRPYATLTFHVTTKLPEAEWVLVIPAWEVWVHILAWDHLTVGYQLLSHRIS